MAQVKMLTSRTDAARGEIITVDADEATRMVAAGQAELVRSAKPEKAVKRGKPEKADK